SAARQTSPKGKYAAGGRSNPSLVRFAGPTWATSLKRPGEWKGRTIRRGGRVVECGGLENRLRVYARSRVRTERQRAHESAVRPTSPKGQSAAGGRSNPSLVRSAGPPWATSLKRPGE